MRNPFERFKQVAIGASLLKDRFSPTEGEAMIQDQLARREQNFLSLVKELFAGPEDSPYRFLFAQAGIDEPEVIRTVAEVGLEATLGLLFDRGVYLNLTEFKGRTPIIRGGVQYQVKPGAFRRTSQRPGFQTRSGGSRSSGTVVNMPVASLESFLFTQAAYDQHSTGPDHASITWLPGPPVVSGLFYSIRGLHLGNRLSRWFTPVPTPDSAKKTARAMLSAFAWPARIMGIPFPRMETVPISSVDRVLADVQFFLSKSRGVFVSTYPSLAVRIAQAALESRVSLSSVTFYVLGEPLTNRRAEIIQSAGASVVDNYGSTEAGMMARSCLDPGRRSLHVFSHSVALILRTKDDSRRSAAVNALYATPISPTSGMAFINVELGDSAEMQTRSCGCPLGALGFTTHLSDLWSYEKLTGEGMTFEAETFIPIIEEAFPRHFGGATAEYQLVEEMDASGLSKLLLIVPERLNEVTDKEFLDYFWECFRAQDSGTVKIQAADIWTRADTLQVRRREPYRTFAGKCLPFHLQRT